MLVYPTTFNFYGGGGGLRYSGYLFGVFNCKEILLSGGLHEPAYSDRLVHWFAVSFEFRVQGLG